jgi:excisionase family DNA binding protein
MPSQKAQPSSMIPHPLGTEIYTTAQVAQALRLSVRTILRAIKSGKLTARRAGKQFLITRDAVAAYWEGMPLAAPEPPDADASRPPLRWDDLAPEGGGTRRR